MSLRTMSLHRVLRFTVVVDKSLNNLTKMDKKVFVIDLALFAYTSACLSHVDADSSYI